MENFETFGLNEAYKRLEELGDKLSFFEKIIDWKKFEPIVDGMYRNKSELGGRPNINSVVMIKLLILQSLYSLSDPELERQVTDRLSFRRFIGFSSTIPDFTTVWKFRERLIKHGKDNEIWAELQRQIDMKGFVIKRGVIQDASFITSDPGHAKADKPRGEQAKSRRSKDGTWAKKGKKSFFGYKIHTVIDKENQLIRRLYTTTASVHDSQIDGSKKGETVYRDKGYFGVKPKASMDKTMKRATRGHPLTCKDKRRNKAISRVRSLVERPFAVIKKIFHGGHTMVTTVSRVHTRNIFSAFSFNLIQLLTLHSCCESGSYLKSKGK